jgi:hypothetical protein
MHRDFSDVSALRANDRHAACAAASDPNYGLAARQPQELLDLRFAEFDVLLRDRIVLLHDQLFGLGARILLGHIEKSGVGARHQLDLDHRRFSHEILALSDKWAHPRRVGRETSGRGRKVKKTGLKAH